jgi:hypothetical protein
VVDGDNNLLDIDGRHVGTHKSSPALANQKGFRMGFSVRGTFASFDDVRVRNHCVPEPETRVGKSATRHGVVVKTRSGGVDFHRRTE